MRRRLTCQDDTSSSGLFTTLIEDPRSSSKLCASFRGRRSQAEKAVISRLRGPLQLVLQPPPAFIPSPQSPKVQARLSLLSIKAATAALYETRSDLWKDVPGHQISIGIKFGTIGVPQREEQTRFSSKRRRRAREGLCHNLQVRVDVLNLGTGRAAKRVGMENISRTCISYRILVIYRNPSDLQCAPKRVHGR